MKNALLIVHFGTTVPKAQESLRAVERTLRESLPEYEVLVALTSPTVRRVLKGRGETVFSLTEMLEQLKGYDRVLVQPTHLLYGFEYEGIARTAAQYPNTVLGKPLLAQTEDLQALARCLKARYADPQRVLVLMGHGTAHFANMVYPAFQTVLRLEGFANSYVGTVEGWPSLDDVMHQLRADDVHSVLLAPMMLVAGDHACNDMAGPQPDSWKSQLEAQGFQVACHMEGLGMLPEVCAIYRKHLEAFSI